MRTVYYAVIGPDTFAKKCTEKDGFSLCILLLQRQVSGHTFIPERTNKKITYLFQKKKVGIIFVK